MTMDDVLPASSRALHTTEILEHILSFLPASDLIAASNVNNLFLNCIVNSPVTQQTLFLPTSVKPSQPCYKVHRISPVRVGYS